MTVKVATAVEESDGSFKVVLEQVKDIPVRMYKGFVENLGEIPLFST